jgi:hypothetical protein
VVIGQALSSFDGSGEKVVIVFVSPFFSDPTMLVDQQGNVSMQRNEASTTLLSSNSNAAFIINQSGSGALLQLQANGENRLLVQNDGSVVVNTLVANDTVPVFTVKNADTNLLTINARGDLSVRGVLTIEDDSFAGSTTTNSSGEAEVTFSHTLGTGKPVVELTTEGDLPTHAQIVRFTTDAGGNYKGFVLKTTTLDGAGVSGGVVHYLVVAKPAGYKTSGDASTALNIVAPPSAAYDIQSPTPPSDTTETDPNTPTPDTTQPPATNDATTNTDPAPAAPSTTEPPNVDAAPTTDSTSSVTDNSGASSSVVSDSPLSNQSQPPTDVPTP